MPTEQLSTFILPWDWHLWARARGLQDGPRWIDGWIGEWSSCKSFILEKRHESWCNCVFFRFSMYKHRKTKSQTRKYKSLQYDYQSNCILANIVLTELKVLTSKDAYCHILCVIPPTQRQADAAQLFIRTNTALISFLQRENVQADW